VSQCRYRSPPTHPEPSELEHGTGHVPAPSPISQKNSPCSPQPLSTAETPRCHSSLPAGAQPPSPASQTPNFWPSRDRFLPRKPRQAFPCCSSGLRPQGLDREQCLYGEPLSQRELRDVLWTRTRCGEQPPADPSQRSLTVQPCRASTTQHENPTARYKLSFQAGKPAGVPPSRIPRKHSCQPDGLHRPPPDIESTSAGPTAAFPPP